MSNIQRHTEHGQDWFSCLHCGASWSIVTVDNNGVDLEDVERIDNGDETCDESDHRHAIETAIGDTDNDAY